MQLRVDELVHLLSLKNKEIALLRHSLINEKKASLNLLNHADANTALVDQIVMDLAKEAQPGNTSPAAAQYPKETSIANNTSTSAVQAADARARNSFIPSSQSEASSVPDTTDSHSIEGQRAAPSSSTCNGSSQAGIVNANERRSAARPTATHAGSAFNTVSITQHASRSNAGTYKKDPHAAYEIFFKTAPDDWIGPHGFDLRKTGIIFEGDTTYYLIYQASGPSSRSVIKIEQPNGHVDYIRTATEIKKGGQIGSYFL